MANILLFEDERPFLDRVTAILWQHNISAYTDCTTLVFELNNYRILDNYDVVVLDLYQDGLGLVGFDIIGEIRGIKPAMPILVLTSDADAEWDAIQHAANYYVWKQVEDLAPRLRAMVRNLAQLNKVLQENRRQAPQPEPLGAEQAFAVVKIDGDHIVYNVANDRILVDGNEVDGLQPAQKRVLQALAIANGPLSVDSVCAAANIGLFNKERALAEYERKRKELAEAAGGGDARAEDRLNRHLERDYAEFAFDRRVNTLQVHVTAVNHFLTDHDAEVSVQRIYNIERDNDDKDEDMYCERCKDQGFALAPLPRE